jgi:hypothetical protein
MIDVAIIKRKGEAGGCSRLGWFFTIRTPAPDELTGESVGGAWLVSVSVRSFLRLPESADGGNP